MEIEKNLKIFGSEIKKEFGENILSEETRYGNELHVNVRKERIAETALFVHARYKAPLMAMFAADERERNGAYKIFYVFAVYRKSIWVVISIDVKEDDPVYPSITPHIYAAHLYEREIRDFFGLSAEGNPDLRRLALHENYPDVHPLRKDFEWNSKLKDDNVPFEFNKIEGEGIFEIPVGPVHAGIIEPGHFRFSAAGEPVIALEIKLHYKHKGIEKIFETMDAYKGVELAERVSGDSSVSHAVCYCQAVEKISGAVLPDYAKYTRMVILELERLYNHIADIGGMATDVGFAFGAAQAGIMREKIMRLNEAVSGSRFLRGVASVGGVKKDILKGNEERINNDILWIKENFEELLEILRGSATFMDRVETAGVLPKAAAKDLGVVGVPARASGLGHDARHDFPYELYGDMDFTVPVYDAGDCYSRLMVRADEVYESIKIIGQTLNKQFGSRVLSAGVKMVEPYKPAIGYVEGWRGSIFYWVVCREYNLIERCKVRDPSFCNWPGLAHAMPGNIVPDFPLCNKSFNLSYSGNDL